MAPLVRRSWAPQGQPSVLKQKAAYREKVSVAAALWLTPLRDKLGLAIQTLVNAYFTNEEVADFLEAGLQSLGTPVIVIWDGGSMHKGDPIHDLLERSEGRLDLEPLPGYSPELMPVEQLRTWLKYNRLPNFAPENAEQLEKVVLREVEPIREDQQRLRNFFHASDLPLPRALLS